MTHATSPKLQLLGISGSIRQQSTNTAVLEALCLRVIWSGNAEMTLFGLEEIPLFNSDLEGHKLPQSVRGLKEAIRSCDGLVLCSPEYNHGMSGVLKNALDWASRPAYESVLKGKPTLIMTSAPSPVGGARAVQQIRETLASCLAKVVARPDVVIPKIHEKIVDGKFVDEIVLAHAQRAIGDLVAEIKRGHELGAARQ